MIFYSFLEENLEKLPQSKIYDMYKPTVVFEEVTLKYLLQIYIVKKEDEMRLDRICQKIYQSNDYVEELMTINGIKNPWSIKEGDILYYLPFENFYQLYKKDTEEDKAIDLMNKASQSKATKRDPDRSGGPPALKPKNKSQVNWNSQNHKIKIINDLS